MTGAPDWTIEARRRIDAGERVLDVARDLGVDDRRLRRELNINGAGDRHKARTRAELTGVRIKTTDAPGRQIDRIIANAYADPKPARPLTLPKISMPDIDEPPLLRRHAPPPPRVAVNEGAERWRAHHERMIRRGLIAEPSDLIERLHH